MKRQYDNKVGFEFTIHFHNRYEISQSDRTQTIETAAEKLLKFNDQSDRLSQILTPACHPSLFRRFETARRSDMESGRAGLSRIGLASLK